MDEVALVSHYEMRKTARERHTTRTCQLLQQWINVQMDHTFAWHHL